LPIFRKTYAFPGMPPLLLFPAFRFHFSVAHPGSVLILLTFHGLAPPALPVASLLLALSCAFRRSGRVMVVLGPIGSLLFLIRGGLGCGPFFFFFFFFHSVSPSPICPPIPWTRSWHVDDEGVASFFFPDVCLCVSAAFSRWFVLGRA